MGLSLKVAFRQWASAAELGWLFSSHPSRQPASSDSFWFSGPTASIMRPFRVLTANVSPLVGWRRKPSFGAGIFLYPCGPVDAFPAGPLLQAVRFSALVEDSCIAFNLLLGEGD